MVAGRESVAVPLYIESDVVGKPERAVPGGDRERDEMTMMTIKRFLLPVSCAALLALPASAWGQEEMVFDDLPEETPSDDLADLLGPRPEPTEDPTEELMDTAALKEPEIWAVQQAYVLRDGRFELTPTYGVSLNDPFVTHNAFGLKFGWYITEVLGIAASFQWYHWLQVESDDNFYIPRSFRLVVPINEYQFGVNLHFSYVPLYGKLAIFRKWIFHWDCFVEGGVGLLHTRPIPVVDPDVRTFDFAIQVAANVGIGVRIFLTKFVAIYAQFVDFIYLEQLESRTVAPEEGDPLPDGRRQERAGSRTDPKTWLGKSVFTNHMALFVGASIFFPFTFEYKYPK